MRIILSIIGKQSFCGKIILGMR